MAFAKLADKSAPEISIAFVNNATDVYDERPAWADDPIARLRSFGFAVAVIDLRNFTDSQHHEQLVSTLERYDAIWVGGGNTFYLRWLMAKTHAETVIANLVERGKIYAGGSAGAIVAGPTLKFFDAADDPAAAPEIIWDGLGLIDTVVIPHIDNEKFAPATSSINNQLKAAGFTTTPLNDNQVLVINGPQRQIL